MNKKNKILTIHEQRSLSESKILDAVKIIDKSTSDLTKLGIQDCEDCSKEDSRVLYVNFEHPQRSSRLHLRLVSKILSDPLYLFSALLEHESQNPNLSILARARLSSLTGQTKANSVRFCITGEVDVNDLQHIYECLQDYHL
jgi:hypothetical protein